MRRILSTVVIVSFSLCVAGGIAFLLMFESRYYDIKEFARWPLFFCSLLGIFLALLLPRGRRPWLRFVLVGVFIIFFCVVLVMESSNYHIPSGRAGALNLVQIRNAMQLYQQEYNGYRPFDERGPLYSLSLLYPEWLDNPVAFQNPFVSHTWKRRNNGVAFPDGTSCAGAICHFGYTWHIPAKAPLDFAIVADMPQFLLTEGDRWCVNVLYADGRIRWEKTPFCSTYAQDNIFAREPGWSPDTDSWIRQE